MKSLSRVFRASGSSEESGGSTPTDGSTPGRQNGRWPRGPPGLADRDWALPAEAFDPQRFLAEFSAPVERLVPHDRLMIAHLERAGNCLSLPNMPDAAAGPCGALHYRLSIGRALLARRAGPEQACWPGKPMLVHDIQADPRFVPSSGAPARVRQAGLRSRLAAPCGAAAAPSDAVRDEL